MEALESKYLKSNNGSPTHQMCELGKFTQLPRLRSLIYKMGTIIESTLQRCYEN